MSVGYLARGLLSSGYMSGGICPGVYVRGVFVRGVFVLEPFIYKQFYTTRGQPQLVSALDLVTSGVQVEGSILTAGKRLSLKNLNVIIRAIN